MKRTISKLGLLAIVFSVTACSHGADPAQVPDPAEDIKPAEGQTSAEAVLAGGCFWSCEAIFERVPGVTTVVSGYAGGTRETANYDAVGSDTTDHAESVKITYDPTKISYGKLLKIFFAAAHDPTQLNRQGPDVGRHYRSTVFFANDEQKRVAQAYMKQLNDSKVYSKLLATTLEPMNGFYAAEDYHQDFVKLHPSNGYISQVLPPKLEKLEKLLKHP